MRVALVGPTHPYKGGIAHHTTELAHRLKAAGHAVDLLSWSEQYPASLYPGVQRVPDDDPEMPIYPGTSYPLSWKNPFGWYRVGRRLRTYEAVILVFVTSVQAPAYLTLLSALGKKGRGRVVALCHNVLPHEPRFFDLPLTKAVLGRVGTLLVHTPEQAELAKGLTPAPIVVADMPPHLPAKPQDRVQSDATFSQRRLLFFGLVRKYKGLDLLLCALSRVPEIQLTVAGEIWGGIEPYERLIAELGIRDRVTLASGYVPSKQISELFAGADALVLPYRSGTATQNIHLAHAHGRPVIATRVGSMAAQVRDGVDGLLCAPDDVEDLTRAIRQFYAPGVAKGLSENLPELFSDGPWQDYIACLLGTHSRPKT